MKDVDWNIYRINVKRFLPVILRTKNVDWNNVAALFTICVQGHSSYEECGLKCGDGDGTHATICRPSYEGCGLKYREQWINRNGGKSSFVRRMWIEIYEGVGKTKIRQSLFVWRMWIEIKEKREHCLFLMSSFVRRMWIEIQTYRELLCSTLSLFLRKGDD